jgi:hypothetical protein
MAMRTGIWLGVWLLAAIPAWGQLSPQAGTRNGLGLLSNPLRSSTAAVQPAQYQDSSLLPELPESQQELQTAPPSRMPLPADADALSAAPQPPAAGTPADPWEGVLMGPADILPPPEGSGTWPVEAYEQYPIGPSPVVMSSNQWFRGSNWYSQTDFVLLKDERIEGVLIAIDLTGPRAQLPTLSTDKAEFNYEEGMRLTLGRSLGPDAANRGRAIEATFWGLFEYTAAATLELTNPDLAAAGAIEAVLGPDIGPPGFGSAQRQTIFLHSELNNAELNLRFWSLPIRDRLVLQPSGQWVQQATPSHLMSFMAGLRFVSLDDEFQMASVGLEPETNRGNFSTTTDNDMFGLQLGVDFNERHPSWEWGGQARLGGLVNFAERQSHLAFVFEDDSVSRFDDTDDETLTALIQTELNAAYYLRPDLALRLSYNVLYLSGIGGALENSSLGPTFPQFTLTNSKLYHGLSTGLELRW